MDDSRKRIGVRRSREDRRDGWFIRVIGLRFYNDDVERKSSFLLRSDPLYACSPTLSKFSSHVKTGQSRRRVSFLDPNNPEEF